MPNPTTVAEIVCTPLTNGQFPGSFGVLGGDFVALSMMALLVSLLMLTLVYIFANFLRNQQLITWTKFELFQVVATAGIFAFTAGIVIGMCTFDMGFLKDDYHGKNMYKIVDAYFDNLKDGAYMLFAYLMYVVKMLNLFAKITWISNPMGVGMTDSPLESFGQMNSLLFFVISGFFTSILLLWLQMRVMDYMAFASLCYLFPFGIFFRAFEPTRKFGGTLIGIAITFFLFYPIVIIFNDYLMSERIDEVNREVSAAAGAADVAAPGLDQQTGSDIQNKLPDLKMKGFGGIATMGKTITNGTLFVLKPVMLYVMAAVVLPVINFIVLAEIARSLTHLFGEEIDVANLTRMI